MTNIYSVLSMSSVAVALMVGNVHAQSIPQEGPISVIFTATPIPAPKPMPVGGGKVFALMDQAMAASNETGTPCSTTWGDVAS